MKTNFKFGLTYFAMVGLFATSLWAVFWKAAEAGHLGGASPAPAFSAISLHGPLSQLLLQVVVIVTIARLAGILMRRLGQPPVIGEMFAGLALGPSLLGWILPSVSAFVFPTAGAGMNALQMLSQVGVLLFMFVVGMELDLDAVRKKARSAVLISHTSILLPFALGCCAALFLYRDYMGAHASFIPFALFIGISMSITAFPVLARIIQERGLVGSPLGNTALTCAAVDDVTAWTGLAIIVALARSQGVGSGFLTLLLVAVFVALMIAVIRPGLSRVVARLDNPGEPGPSVAVLVLTTVFVSALFTEAVGIHALFGAFFAGAMMPAHKGFRFFLKTRLEYFSSLFLLPIFFAYTGLRTQIGLLSGAHDYTVCLALLAIAVVGKFGGSMLAGRVTGMSWKEAVGIGALMNTRGLIELIALNLGLDLGVLSPKIFAMLVLMAVITTAMTGPALSLLSVGHSPSAGPQVGEESEDALASLVSS